MLYKLRLYNALVTLNATRGRRVRLHYIGRPFLKTNRTCVRADRLVRQSPVDFTLNIPDISSALKYMTGNESIKAGKDSKQY